MRIASYRPGVVSNMSAFEAMADIYKYLMNKYGWQFTIYKSVNDNYQDEQINVKNIPENLRSRGVKKYLYKELSEVDAILGCDPTVYDQGILSSEIAKVVGVPHAFDSSLTLMGDYKSLRWKLRKKSVLEAVNNTDLIWATTPKVLERFKDLGLSDPNLSEKVITLGHPVDTNKFSPLYLASSEIDEKNYIEILCVSRLVIEKGLHYIIYAVSPIIKKHKNVRLKIVGKGDVKKFLDNIIEEEGIIDNVDFVEEVNFNTMPMIYRNADLYITHPIDSSRWEEYFGVANLEAMACEVPIITTDSGGIPFVLREKDSRVIVKQRDVAQLSDIIEKIIERKEYRVLLGKKGREFVVNNYSIEIIAEKYKKYLEQTIKKYK